MKGNIIHTLIPLMPPSTSYPSPFNHYTSVGGGGVGGGSHTVLPGGQIFSQKGSKGAEKKYELPRNIWWQKKYCYKKYIVVIGQLFLVIGWIFVVDWLKSLSRTWQHWAGQGWASTCLIVLRGTQFSTSSWTTFNCYPPILLFCDSFDKWKKCYRRRKNFRSKKIQFCLCLTHNSSLVFVS